MTITGETIVTILSCIVIMIGLTAFINKSKAGQAMLAVSEDRGDVYKRQVKDTPGVTRDRIYADCDWLNMNFTLIDTGGIEPDSKDIILSQMREQAEIAISTADVIIFIVDVRQGLVDSDSKVADILRKSHKPVVLAVNKVDSVAKYGNDVDEFYNLGIEMCIRDRARMVLLNKSDLADERQNARWAAWFEAKGIHVVKIDARNKGTLKQVKSVIQEACKEKIERDRRRGILNRPIRTTVSYTHLDVYKRQVCSHGLLQ